MNIALITGGPSAERDVSVNSSISILKALRENGHNVLVLDPVYGEEQPGEEEIFSHKVRKESPSPEQLEEINRRASRNILKFFSGDVLEKVDFAFLGLHGKFGEDGKVQALLEMRGVKYSGSGIFASALAMDKDVTKVVLRSKGIMTPAWITVSRSDDFDAGEIHRLINEKIGYPCVVKPNDEGSTVGLSIVSDSAEITGLIKAIELAFSYSEKVVIEKFTRGREITVPVIGNKAFPVVEIRPKGGFYDYEHKYTKGMTDYFCPAQLEPEIEARAKQVSIEAHKALGCSVYSRIDYILDDQDNLQCLEVNTLPGMTETSLVPKSAHADGISFNELVQKIIDLSLKKF